MRRLDKFSLIGVMLFIAVTASGCADDAKSRSDNRDEPVTIAFTRTMHSDILNEDRTLYVYLSSGYDPTNGFRTISGHSGHR